MMLHADDLSDKILEWAETADANNGFAYGIVSNNSDEWQSLHRCADPELKEVDPEWCVMLKDCAVLGLCFVAAIARSKDLP
jgi:hypothetical protein